MWSIKGVLIPFGFRMCLTDLFSGLVGGRMANLAALFSYLVDVCTMKERTLRLSVAEGLISLSVGIASGGSGFVARHYSLTPVMIFYWWCRNSCRSSSKFSSWKSLSPKRQNLLEVRNWPVCYFYVLFLQATKMHVCARIFSSLTATHTNTHTQHTHTHTHTFSHTRIWKHTCASMHERAHTFMPSLAHTSMLTRPKRHRHSYTCICTHTCTHACRNIHTYKTRSC